MAVTETDLGYCSVYRTVCIQKKFSKIWASSCENLIFAYVETKVQISCAKVQISCAVTCPVIAQLKSAFVFTG